MKITTNLVPTFVNFTDLTPSQRSMLIFRPTCDSRITLFCDKDGDIIFYHDSFGTVGIQDWHSGKTEVGGYNAGKIIGTWKVEV